MSIEKLDGEVPNVTIEASGPANDDLLVLVRDTHDLPAIGTFIYPWAVVVSQRGKTTRVYGNAARDVGDDAGYHVSSLERKVIHGATVSYELVSESSDPPEYTIYIQG